MLRIPYSTLYGCIDAVLQGHSKKSEAEVILLIHLKPIDLNKNEERNIIYSNAYNKLFQKEQSKQAEETSTSMESDIFKEFKKNERIGQDLAKKFHKFFESTPSIPATNEHVPNNVGKNTNTLSSANSFKNITCNTKDICKSLARNKVEISYEIGHVNMAPHEIAQNMKFAINCIVSCLDNSWSDIRTLHLKSSSGQSYKLF